jgi:DNA-binding NarL/FixJ family response regulator
VIADDHPAARAGIRESLEADEGFQVVAEAEDAEGAVEAALRERPDLCVLDVHMPGGGIRAARDVASALPNTAVVMLTVSRDDADLFDALRAGAAGYLLKDTNPTRLAHALRGVLAGEAAVPRILVARLIDEFRGHGRRRFRLAGRGGANLTNREWEVLEMMHEGLTTAEISRRLFVSPVTVRRHVSGVLAKLDVSTRDEALRLIQDEGRWRNRGAAGA